jgi:ATP-binding cassette subfamily F protein 3
MLLTLDDVARAYGARTLFSGVSLRVVAGARIALVGANGSGKTTLLELMHGDQQPDAGAVHRAKGLTIGFLHQEVAEARGRSAVEEVLAGAGGVAQLERRLREIEELVARAPAAEQDTLLEEYARLSDRFEHLGGYAVESDARRILGGLGFAEDQMDHDLATMSGGWMMRVALGRLLLAAPDLLLLDEPTNHLDLASVTWLQQFLRDYPGAVVLVSHDRDFINTIATRVVELAFSRATEYAGDYAAFVEQRTLRLEQQRAAARNQQRKIVQTERFIERFRYKATKARQVQSRVKMLDRMEQVALDDDNARTMRFAFPKPPRAGRDVVKLEGVVKRYGDNLVYDGLDLVLERGRKVALVGPNGAGKSTLLRILAGVLEFEGGQRVLGHNVTVAYFAQHTIESLDLGKTVLAELTGAVDTATVNPRSMLGAFLFSGDDVDKRARVLSGGERARLALAKLLANPANLLCMDEPTNHLDIPSRDVLEDALVEYPGTVVLITHDRHLIRSTADTIIDVRDGGATVYPGDYAYFADKTGLDLDGSQRGPAASPAPAEVKPAEAGRTELKRAEAERRNRVYRATKDLRRQVQRVEADLGRAEAEVADLTRALADPGVYADPERVKDLVARHSRAKDRAAELTDRWAELGERLERSTANAERPG